MPNRSQIDAPPVAPPPAARADDCAGEEDSNGCPTSVIASDNAGQGQLATPVADAAPFCSESTGTPIGNEASDLVATGEGGIFSLAARRTPAALASFIVHTVLLLLLATLTITPRVGVLNSLNFDSATGDGDLAEAFETQTFEMLAGGDSLPPPADMASDISATSQPSDAVSPQPISELLQIDPSANKVATPAATLAQGLSQATSDLSVATLASTGVDGRSLENREQAAKARGGTLESELAVERALDWLAAHQLPNGGWSLVHDGGKCKGQCKNNGSDARYEPAATGLALLAFLGAGYTHKTGKHQRTVHDGVYYLLQIMEEANNTGSFLHQSERGMYNHGIAAFALCEAYQLSGDEDLKNPAQLAVNFIFSAQNYAGGWGYLPKQPGDLTISGWQMMAIKSAHAAGLDVPASVIIRIDNFLDTKQVPSGIFYGYGKPATDPTCSAIGMLLRLFRGWPHTDSRALELGQFLVKQGKSNSDVYYNYYATLLLFHLGGPAWETWNPRIREHLVKTQSQAGHEAGSWFFEDQYAKEGGRLYTTAMCAMTLEVYYRFSPLYQQADKPFEL